MVVWSDGANDLHMVQLMPLPPCHLLLHSNRGCPGKEAVKRMSVCLSILVLTYGFRAASLLLSSSSMPA